MNHAVICTKVMLLKTSENVFRWLNGEYFKLMFQKLGGLGGRMPLHAEYCDRIMQQLRKVNRYLEYKCKKNEKIVDIPV